MKRTVVITITTAAAVLGLAACGGSSSPAPTAGSATAPAATAPSATPSAGATGGTNAAGGGAGGRGAGGQLAGLAAELPAIKTCLTAAGISTADLPTAVPSFAGRASGAPRPSNRPSGGFGGGGFAGGAATGGGRFGGLFTILTNAQDQTALKACGITVPTFTGRAPGAAAPTTAATTT